MSFALSGFVQLMFGGGNSHGILVGNSGVLVEIFDSSELSYLDPGPGEVTLPWTYLGRYYRPEAKTGPQDRT